MKLEQFSSQNVEVHFRMHVGNLDYVESVGIMAAHGDTLDGLIRKIKIKIGVPDGVDIDMLSIKFIK